MSYGWIQGSWVVTETIQSTKSKIFIIDLLKKIYQWLLCAVAMYIVFLLHNSTTSKHKFLSYLESTRHSIVTWSEISGSWYHTSAFSANAPSSALELQNPDSRIPVFGQQPCLFRVLEQQPPGGEGKGQTSWMVARSALETMPISFILSYWSAWPTSSTSCHMLGSESGWTDSFTIILGGFLNKWMSHKSTLSLCSVYLYASEEFPYFVSVSAPPLNVCFCSGLKTCPEII